MIASGSLVVLYLCSPREKYWGRVMELSAVGVQVRGMDLAMVEDWARELARGDESTLGPTGVFFPMWRVEKIFLDEDVGAMRSVGSGFLQIVGRGAEEYI